MRRSTSVGTRLVILASLIAGVGLFGSASGSAPSGRLVREALDGLIEAGSAQSMPGPSRGPRASDRVDRNAECVVCHSDIADEWRGSLHQQSFSDPMFQAALEREREDLGFCRSCHAPEADPRHEPSKPAAAIGVGCVTCHLPGIDDAVLAAARTGVDDSKVPHPLRRVADFSQPDACARCHEFWFPGSDRAGHELKMQRTISEHRRSAFADESCQACHMTPTRTAGSSKVHRGHGFAVASEPRMLRAAVSADATRPEPEQVVIELRPRLVGHAFPTGDLFRRLVVRVASDDASWSEQRYLARHFGVQRVGAGQTIKIEHADDRIGIGGTTRTLEFELPAELHDRSIRWTLSWERVLDGAGDRAKVWDRVVVLEGTLAPPRAAR